VTSINWAQLHTAQLYVRHPINTRYPSLSHFIEQNIEAIVAEWEAFARKTISPAQTMSRLALRDHAAQILLAIAKDLRSPQTEAERLTKSQGLAQPTDTETSAATHGVLRQLVGFDLVQLAAEYRAVRATVLRLWKQTPRSVDENAIEDVARFNEAVDQSLAESIASYSERVANSRDTFLAILGHDLRSPLSAITSALLLLGDTRAQEQQRHRALQIAKRSATSMRRMITDLLEYTRSRLGRGIEIVPTTGDISNLCRDVFEEVEAAHSDRIFTANVTPEITTRFDAARMRQVLTNLLSNAVQYGDASFPISLRVAREGDEALVAVSNRGKTISPDALQVIFDPLVQIPTTGMDMDGPSEASLGLGLYIVHEIVTAHGATISVTSTESDGTVFTVRLPPDSSVGKPLTLN
jgi:signal transduction histidine kinase